MNNSTNNNENLSEKVYGHYVQQAELFGYSWESTMHDRIIRETEINSLIKVITYLLSSPPKGKKSLRILEVGCGNGYVSARLSCEFPNLVIDAFDINTELILAANHRKLPNCTFKVGDITDSVIDKELSNDYDLIFTVRCLINIEDPSDQLKSIEKMSSKLAVNGVLALLEGFINGQDKYNVMRNLLNFNTIPPAWHNWYLDKDKVDATLAKSGLLGLSNPIETVGVNPHHLSSHYLATRVLQPFVHQDPNHYMVHRNDDIGQAISHFLPASEYFSPLQINLWIRQIPTQLNN